MVAKSFNRRLLEETREAWSQQVQNVSSHDQSVLAGGYEVVLGWVGDALTNPDQYKYSHPYGLVKDDESHASTILKLTLADPPSADEAWLKLLDIHMEPNLDVLSRQNVGEEHARKAERHLSKAVTEALRLTHEDLEAGKLKIFGRDGRMESYFDLIVEKLREEDDTPNVRAERHGSWLVIEKVS